MATPRVVRSRKGWIVATDSNVQGSTCGRRVLVTPQQARLAHDVDLGAPINGHGTTTADVIAERAFYEGARVLRRGVVVR